MREPPDGSGPLPELECAQPEVGDEPGRDDRPEQQQVPRDGRPEEAAERPVEKTERPAAEHGLLGHNAETGPKLVGG